MLLTCRLSFSGFMKRTRNLFQTEREGYPSPDQETQKQNCFLTGTLTLFGINYKNTNCFMMTTFGKGREAALQTLFRRQNVLIQISFQKEDVVESLHVHVCLVTFTVFQRLAGGFRAVCLDQHYMICCFYRAIKTHIGQITVSGTVGGCGRLPLV